MNPMKKMIVILLIMAMAVTSFTVVSTTEASASTTKYINVDALNVRAKASTSGKKLGTVSLGDKVTVIGTSGSFYKISYKGKTGYISKKYTSSKEVKKVTQTKATATETKVADSKISVTTDAKKKSGSQVLAYGKKFIGNPYRHGGTSLTRGADCSGFVKAVYAHFGVSLPHSSSAMRSYGKKVSVSAARAGDIVCYNGHVGLYAGGGKILNAANSRRGICYSPLYQSKKLICVRRIF
ncbi:P60 extracellular protein, invasion associated protein Iap [Lachnospiraceae bacterium TWA4]|nr:P60 extracellular protein, invasion associated protein Iap [Lachnospiraceae bacterium TWA4]